MARPSLRFPKARTIRIRSSNITQWRHEVQKWLQAQSDDIILVQETHLTKEGVSPAVSAMHKAGYEMFGGEAAPSNKKRHVWRRGDSLQNPIQGQNGAALYY